MRRSATVVAVTLAGLAPAAGTASAAEPASVPVEEYVCYPSDGDEFRIGRGWAFRLPDGNVVLICTDLPLRPTRPHPVTAAAPRVCASPEELPSTLHCLRASPTLPS